MWRQVLVENTKIVKPGSETYSVRRTPRKGLRQADFVFDSEDIRGLEQNPNTKSRWAQLAQSGRKVMQSQRGSLRCKCCGWKGDSVWASLSCCCFSGTALAFQESGG